VEQKRRIVIKKEKGKVESKEKNKEGRKMWRKDIKN
jgi:hypothetical protein